MIYGKRMEADAGTAVGNGSAAGTEVTGAGSANTTTQTAATVESKGVVTGTTTPPGETDSAGQGSASGAAKTNAWTDGLSDEFKGYIEHKGYKTAEDVLKAHKSLEKFIGIPKDEILRMPKADDAEGWKEFNAKLGKPEKPEGYKIEAPKEGGDPKFVEWAKTAFHDSDLTAKQAEKMLGQWNEYVKGMQDTQQKEIARQSQEQATSLESEWGRAHEQNTNLAKKAATTFLEGDEASKQQTIEKLQTVLGYDKTMKLFHAIGSKMSEDNFISGDSASGFKGILSPNAAKARIQELTGSKDWSAKFLAKDPKTMAEFKTLHEQAYSTEE